MEVLDLLSNKTLNKRKQIITVLLHEGAISVLKYEGKLKKIRQKSHERKGRGRPFSNVKRKQILVWRKKYNIYQCRDCDAGLDEYGPMHHVYCDFCWKARKRLGLPTHPISKRILESFDVESLSIR